MSSIGSAVGGKLGNTPSTSNAFPSFESPGGVTPQQSSLAQYDYGQSLVADQGQFAGSNQASGPIMSTMDTQAAGGANIGKALNLVGSSDTDQTAQFGAFENAINIAQQNQGEVNIAQTAQNQGLAQLASQAGKIAKAGGFTAGST